MVRGVGGGLEVGRIVDGIGRCVWASMFLVPCVLHIYVQSYRISSFLTLFVFLSLSSGPCIYMRCASLCVSPCCSPLVGWGLVGGSCGVVRGRGGVWCEERAIV